MATYTLYAFLTDDTLRTRSRVDTDQTHDQGYGILEGEVAAYFIENAYFNDTRVERQSLIASHGGMGAMRLVFDKTRCDEECISFINELPELEAQRLTNIVERIAYQQNILDTAIEQQLTSNAGYAGYVPNTFMHSVEMHNVTATNNQGGSVTIPIAEWCEFQYRYEETTLTIHFWISSKIFKSEYPFVTITRVIPPYLPEKLIDPTALLAETNLNILSGGSSHIFSETNLEAIAGDQNGVYTYDTKYVIEPSRYTTLPFAFAYCGARAPSDLECREALKKFFKDETGISDDNLEDLFPELFVNSRFYIVPLWDMYTQLTERDVYNSIWSMKQVITKMNKIFVAEDAGFVSEHIELLTNAQNKMLLMSLPDKLNTELFSILEQHPTYQDYSSMNSSWKYMEAHTQEFAGKLIRCLAVLTGDAVSEEFPTITDGGFTYNTFTAGKAEYFVMDKMSYISHVETV